MVDERRAEISAAARRAPEDAVVGRLSALQADVAGCRFLDRVDRRQHAVRVGDVDQTFVHDRCGHRNVAAAGERPDFLAGLEVVGADLAHAVDEDLRLPVDRVNGRCAPCRHVAARDAPHFAAVLRVEHREEGSLLHVRLDDHHAVMDHRRAARLPLRAGHHVVAGVEQAEVLLPEQLPLHVEDVEPFGAEEGRDAFAVGRERGVGVARLGVPLHLRHALVDALMPFDGTGLLVERVDPPFVRRVVLDRRDVAVEADLQIRVRLAADGRGDEHVVPPDDRTRQAEAGDFGAPGDVGPLRRVPGDGHAESFGDAGGLDAAELRPVDARPRGGRRGQPGAGNSLDHQQGGREQNERADTSYATHGLNLTPYNRILPP